MSIKQDFCCCSYSNLLWRQLAPFVVVVLYYHDGLRWFHDKCSRGIYFGFSYDYKSNVFPSFQWQTYNVFWKIAYNYHLFTFFNSLLRCISFQFYFYCLYLHLSFNLELTLCSAIKIVNLTPGLFIRNYNGPFMRWRNPGVILAPH